ncbi:MAG TPA: dihydrolipoyl dehydrogenase, partial [Firmicutes bacterium]|nr:dihydrolipoyl dehydrogenase [Bacillota bacterium]
DIRVYKHFFKASGKAVVEGNDAGFIKIIEHSGIIAGAAAAGGEIAELMNELSVIVNAGLTPKQVKRALHIHPSYSEIIIEALVYGGT